MLKTLFIILFGAPILILASMQWFTYDHALWWKATILATEFGHFIAIAVLFWGYLLPRKLWSYLFQISLVGIFLTPAIRAEKIANRMNHKISFRDLFIGYTFRERRPETFIYKSENKVDLRLDYYSPLQPTKKWILIVHGGGWDSGDRYQLEEWNYLLSQQTNNAVAVFSIDYRLAPQYPWPHARDDIADAIKFIRSKSDDFKIDPDSYYLLGRSAGGQLAATVAYQYKQLNLTKPLGVILFYAPTDLTFGYEVAEPHDLIESRSLIRNFMGSDPLNNVEAYKAASPVELVDADACPTLLIHGRPDNLSWFKHSERLAARLTFHKIPNMYVDLPWATHGFDFNPYGPAGQIARFAISDFIK